MFSRRDFLVAALLAPPMSPAYSQQVTATPTEASGQKPDETPVEHKTLVVYYSHSGQSERVAKILADQLSASLYRIETSRPYNPLNAKDDRQKGFLPDIRRNFPPLKNFDHVVLVFPIWGYTVSLPMQKFLSLVNLQDKQIDAVAVGNGKLGGTFVRLDEMLKGAPLQKTNIVIDAQNLSEAQLKTILAKWNTGNTPKQVLLGKGIQVNATPLLKVMVENPAFSLRMPRTAKYSASTAPAQELPKPTDSSPGAISIQPDGTVWVDGVQIGKATSKLPKGTFIEEEPLTLY